jgi:Leucine-rich repeat (LRR) protein
VTHSCVVQTLENLRVLRLDNNKIQRIENISHLVNLEWLGASRVYR